MKLPSTSYRVGRRRSILTMKVSGPGLPHVYLDVIEYHAFRRCCFMISRWLSSSYLSDLMPPALFHTTSGRRSYNYPGTIPLTLPATTLQTNVWFSVLQQKVESTLSAHVSASDPYSHYVTSNIDKGSTQKMQKGYKRSHDA